MHVLFADWMVNCNHISLQKSTCKDLKMSKRDNQSQSMLYFLHFVKMNVWHFCCRLSANKLNFNKTIALRG